MWNQGGAILSPSPAKPACRSWRCPPPQIDAPTSLAALGLPRDAIDAVAETVAGTGVVSPRPVTESDVVLLLRSAYAGTLP
jgi:hypothetical protein